MYNPQSLDTAILVFIPYMKVPRLAVNRGVFFGGGGGDNLDLACRVSVS